MKKERKDTRKEENTRNTNRTRTRKYKKSKRYGDNMKHTGLILPFQWPTTYISTTSLRVDCWELIWRMQTSSPLKAGLLINNAAELGKPWCLNVQYGAGAVQGQQGQPFSPMLGVWPSGSLATIISSGSNAEPGQCICPSTVITRS